jgi:predicted DsbA family dithiol-disulfide isomerase
MTQALTRATLEIWSDIACPWCYIGKVKFTAALDAFAHNDRIDVQWRAYQLSPETPVGLRKPEIDALVEMKGLPPEQVRQMFGQVSEAAASSGLTIDFDTVIAANTFDAHRLVALAGNERDAVLANLFRAHFVDGRVVDDRTVLAEIARESGMSGDIEALLASDAGTDSVQADIAEARALGVTGVPFFVADRRVAVSGAQPAEVFTQLLQRAVESA